MTGAPPGAAVVLPGEDAAVPGALDAWLSDEDARDVVVEVSDLLGRDVVPWWRDRLALNDPAVAALATVVTGIAGARSLVGSGLRPVAYAGYGVGEYAALVAADALPLDQVVDLVVWRGEMLAHAPRPCRAGMAAVVGPGAGEVARQVVEEIGAGGLTVAAVDAPTQVVLSGPCDDLACARQVVAAAGLGMARLPGRVASHGPLVRTIAARLAATLADLAWTTPTAPVLPNLDARPTRDPDHLTECLRRHLTSPVQWEATSRALVDEAGATSVVEVGAVPTLGPLIRQVHPDLPVQLASRPGPPVPPPLTEPVLTGPSPTRGEP